MNQNLSVEVEFEFESYPLDFIDSAYFMTTLSSPKIQMEQNSRAPIDLLCVIDKSGSMAGNKIDLVKKSLLFTLDQLSLDDKISIITFDVDVYLDCPMTQVTEENKKEIKDIIEKIEIGTSTNISEGLFKAFEELKKLKNPNQVSSIILFTDGLPNNGIQDSDEMKEFINKSMKQLKRPTTLFTFGFGVDHDGNLLSDIAGIGNGLYYFIEKEKEIIGSFAGCIGGLLTVVAQDVNLIIYRDVIPRTSYVTIKDDKVQIVLGDIYSEEKKDILFKVDLPKIEKETIEEIKIEVKYYDVIVKEMKSISMIKKLYRKEKSIMNTPNIKLDIQRNRINTSEILEKVKKLAQNDQLDEAKLLIKMKIESIEKSPSYKEDFCKGLIQDLNGLLSQIENKSSYTLSGSKMLNDFLLSTKKQRSTNLSLTSTISYSTSMKKSMKEKSSSTEMDEKFVNKQLFKKINPNFFLKLKTPYTIQSFLKQNNLETYEKLFLENGFDDFTIFSELQRSDFEKIGITVLGHLKLLEIKCQDLKKTAKFKKVDKTDVLTFLKSIEMLEYVKNFVENGFENLEIFPKLTRSDFQSIGIKLEGHLRKLEIYSKQIEN